MAISGILTYVFGLGISGAIIPLMSEGKFLQNEIWIIAIKNIKKDEELSYDYGYQFDEDDYKDHVCKCGSKNCIGFIISEDDWPKYRKHIKK